MGLDMYLFKKHYTKNWSHMPPENHYQVEVRQGGSTLTRIRPERVSSVTEDVGYWRKANHIHAWFVKNVQEGIDDCGTYYVSRATLEELRRDCLEALFSPDRAEEVLPTQSGFFFGGTEYDEYYMESLRETAELIKNLLDEDGPDAEAYSHYEYHSSW
jgi:hypothetical protein